MSGILTGFGDRILERLAPKGRAKADTSFYQFCYCALDWVSGTDLKWYASCHVVGGTSSCTSCNYRGGGC